MNVDRRGFAESLTGVVGALAAGPKVTAASPTPPAASLARAQARLAPAMVTRIRVFYPPNYNPNGPQAFPQSNMVVLVDTDAGITGIGQGGSPDTVRNVARSKVWPNDRPGLGISVDEKQLTFIEAMTEAAPGKLTGGQTARSRTGNR